MQSTTVFIADRLTPFLGMERALRDLLMLDFVSDESTRIVLLSGSDRDPPMPVKVTRLGATAGFRGRLSVLFALRRYARSHADAQFIGVGIWATISFAMATIGLRVRVIHWEHSLLPWRLRHELKVLLAAMILTVLSWKVSATVVVSRSVGSVCRVLLLRHVTVIPNVIHALPTACAPKVEHSLQSAEIRVLGIGSLNPRKNWSLAISALTFLPKEYVLTIAGDGPDLAALKRLVSRLGLTDRVNLAGYSDDVTGLLRECWVVVHPSFAETFGYSLYEAAAVRRPVVAIAAPVMSDFIPTLVPGLLAPRSSPRDYARSIRQAAEAEFDFEKSEQLRSAFSEGRISAQWRSVLEAGRS